MALFVFRDQTAGGTVYFPDGGKVVVVPGTAFTVPDQFVPQFHTNPALAQIWPIPTGTTAQRPAGALPVGTMYWDSTLAKPCWWNGSVWKDATGLTV